MYINVKNVPIRTFIYTYYLHLYTFFYIYIIFHFHRGMYTVNYFVKMLIVDT